MTLVGPSTQEKLLCALDSMIETTQDFTDSAYTSHENREKILQVCDRVKQEMISLLQIGAKLVRILWENTLYTSKYQLGDLLNVV